MKLSEFDYDLPKELIAKYPLKERQRCRLMVLDRKKRLIAHKTFEDIAGYFNKGDLLVLNDTKVILARLFGRRKTGGKVELFLLDVHRPGVATLGRCSYEVLVRPSGRLKEGEKITMESGAEAEMLGRGEIGRFVRFNRPIEEMLESGHVPLPPYIDRLDEPDDRGSYQTVYAAREGATASPTAGLHFTRELLSRIASCAVRIAYVTLHTNYGTFEPIKTENVESHRMHKEYFELPAGTIEVVRETKKNGGKVFAVGTTTTRVLEYCASCVIASPAEGDCFARHCEVAKGNRSNLKDGLATSSAISKKEIASLTSFARNDGSVSGYTNMFIYPGYQFKAVDHLITNFHLPKSTLVILAGAFAGKDFIFEAYRQAVKEKYRFFSYGDAMLII